MLMKLHLLNYFTAHTVISVMIGVGRSLGKDAWITDGHAGRAVVCENLNVVLERNWFTLYKYSI